MTVLARRIILAFAVALCLGPAAVAQELDCRDPETQVDMTACAVADFEAADKALNAQWKITRKVVAERDAASGAASKGAEQALLKAQRAWIDHLEKQCEDEATSEPDGSMYGMEMSTCRANLTRARTQQLKSVAQQP